ncbi:MAG: DMT family transporter [Pseudomonadota bacterium]
MSWLTGVLFAIASAAAFATNTPLASIVHDAGGNAALVVLSRSILAVLVAGAIWLVMPERKSALCSWRVASILAVFFFLQGVLYVGSVKWIPVSMAALIFFTWPVLVGVFAVVMDRNLSIPKVLGCALVAFLGLGLALRVELQNLDPRGVVLALAGSATMVGYVLVVHRKLSSQGNPVALTLQVNLGIVIIAGVMLAMQADTVVTIGSDAILPLLALSGFYVIAAIAQITAIRRSGATLTAIFFNLEPLVSIAIAVAWLNELFTGEQALGALLVIGALVLFSVFHWQQHQLPTKSTDSL